LNTTNTGLNSTKQEHLLLAGVEVSLWRTLLNETYDPAHERSLSSDELVRANRYLSPLVRQRFITSRATLRAILAEYLNIKPGDVEFQYSRQGKPALGEQHPLRFNISHSENLLVVAVTWGHEVGIDVEAVRSMPEADTIAAQYFSPTEYECYQTLPDDIKLQAFFNCWTRKEAYIKACGEGLALPLSSFEVSFLPGEPPYLLRPAVWPMYAFSPAPDYIGALAVAGRCTDR
jgi:4'-phosphopantetheinyl transferase